MKAIGIAADSYCGILPEEAKRLGVMVLPMPFYFEDECFYEEVSITRTEFFEKLAAGQKVSTSQHSPEAVTSFWREGLKEYEKLLYFPLSSGLSGACDTAKVLSREEEFDGRVLVVDLGRIATPLHRSILDALEMIDEGLPAETIRDRLEAARENMSIYIAVETLELLKQSGRINPATAVIGTMLNIKPVLKLGVGILEKHSISRGMKKARKDIIALMKQEMEETFREYHDNNEIYLLAASSADEETTRGWVEEIQAAFPGMEVLCDYLTLGVACHVGQGALGIGCSCRPKRT